MTVKLSQEKIAIILAEYPKGRPSTCIAKELGISAETVIKKLHEHGVPVRAIGKPQLVTREYAELAMKLRAKGKTWPQVSAEIGFCADALHRAVKTMKKNQEAGNE